MNPDFLENNHIVNGDDKLYFTIKTMIEEETDYYTSSEGSVFCDGLGEAKIASSILKLRYPEVHIEPVLIDEVDGYGYRVNYTENIDEGYDGSNQCPECSSDSLNFIEYQGDFELYQCDDCNKYFFKDSDGKLYSEDEIGWDEDSGLYIKEGYVKKKDIDAGLGGLPFMKTFNTGKFNGMLDNNIGSGSDSSAPASTGAPAAGAAMGEAIEKHNTLNPELFDENNELKPEVKDKLLEIVEKFKQNLVEDGIELDLTDIQIIGSNASYNYTKDSDIDLHLFTDLSIYKDCKDLAEKLYLAYKSLFNNKYDPTIYGYPVEVYVEPKEATHISSGAYSLFNGWVITPEDKTIPDPIDISADVKKYEEMAKKCDTVESIDDFIDNIYKIRHESLLTDGEFGHGNLLFKELRNLGILGSLKEKKIDLENLEMSLL